jgi:hypothetical protein
MLVISQIMIAGLFIATLYTNNYVEKRLARCLQIVHK